jgi:hypothetical protein
LNVWSQAITNCLAVLFAAWIFAGASTQARIASVAGIRAAVYCGLFVPLFLWQAKRASGLSLIALFGAVSPAICISVIIAVSQWLMVWLGLWTIIDNKYAALLISASIAGITWFMSVRILDKQASRYLSRIFGMGRETVIQLALKRKRTSFNSKPELSVLDTKTDCL